ncbi:MAG TPA: DUF1990 family protein [Polyangiaceae bacterium]|nr:DUF1990 family protein [Polyangiaceae bacterium]
MMAERVDIPWRWGQAFSPHEIARQLKALDGKQSAVQRAAAQDTTFEHYYSEAIIAREAPGPPRPGGAFERACELSARYEFSDPRIVIGHFDPARPLLGRPLLLELRALGLRLLVGVRIEEVREQDDAAADVSLFAWRYDTLPGHVEFGSEWFRVLQRHSSGEVSFQIEARWRAGEFPNAWMRTGFGWVVHRYQRAWHRLAYVRLRRLLASGPLPSLPSRRRILHSGLPARVGRVGSESTAIAAELVEHSSQPTNEVS